MAAHAECPVTEDRLACKNFVVKEDFNNRQRQLLSLADKHKYNLPIQFFVSRINLAQEELRHCIADVNNTLLNLRKALDYDSDYSFQGFSNSWTTYNKIPTLVAVIDVNFFDMACLLELLGEDISFY